MTTAKDAEHVSDLAATIIGGILEAHSAVDFYRGGCSQADRDSWAQNFVANLHDIEDATEAMGCAMRNHGRCFTAVNDTPVILWQPPACSVHGAINNAGREVGAIGIAIHWENYPESRQPGRSFRHGDYPCCDDDILANLDIAMTAFRDFFPTEAQMNPVWTMREQELVRVLDRLGPAGAPGKVWRASRPRASDSANKQVLTQEPAETGLSAGDNKRPAYDRDHLWLKWHKEDESGHAEIRDRWDAMPDDERKAVCLECWKKIGDVNKNAGRDVVKKALQKAKHENS